METAAFQSRLKTDPAGAVAEAQALPAGKTQADRLTEALAALAGQDPAAARAGAQSITAPLIRQQALAAIAERLISTDPAAAADVASSLDWKILSQVGENEKVLNLTPPFLQDPEIRNDLIGKLMAAAPLATAEALTHSPDPSSTPMEEAMKNWLSLRPEEASTWLRELPAGPAKDLGVRAITDWLTGGRLLPPDYPSALAWAQSSTGSGRQDDTLRLLRQWAKADADAALAGLQALPMPEEEKEPIFRELEQMKSLKP